MPSASSSEAQTYVRALFCGNSGSGKTGALLSLIEAGYHIRLLDMDNGRDILINYIKANCPERLHQLSYQSFRDKMKVTNAGPKPKGTPVAFQNALRSLDEWDDGTNPAEWGSNYILVVDALTSLSRAAKLWAAAMNPTAKDNRQIYFAAQEIIEDTIASLTDDDFKCNVLVITHIDQADPAAGVMKDYPASVGKALGPKIGRYFNTLILSETKGSGDKVRHKIHTVSTASMDLKTAAPLTIEGVYDISNGLAAIFESLRGTTPETTEA